MPPQVPVRPCACDTEPMPRYQLGGGHRPDIDRTLDAPPRHSLVRQGACLIKLGKTSHANLGILRLPVEQLIEMRGQVGVLWDDEPFLRTAVGPNACTRAQPAATSRPSQSARPFPLHDKRLPALAAPGGDHRVTASRPHMPGARWSDADDD